MSSQSHILTSRLHDSAAKERIAARVRTNHSRPALPFVYINVATTADGKLAPANRVFVPFGGQLDQERLLELRTKADAVMAGARTIDLYPVNMGPGPKKYRQMRLRHGLSEYNLRVVVSGSGTVNPKAEIFRHRFSPIIVLTTERIPRARLVQLCQVADEVKVCGKEEVDFTEALRWLRQHCRVKHLLCEGGGELNEGLFRAGLVHEVHLTLCPVIFGGQDAPTMADGRGVESLAESTQLDLRSMKRVGNELFLVYRVRKSSSE